MTASRVVWLFAWLVSYLPARFDPDDAASMVETFALRWANIRPRGAFPAAAFLLSEFAGLIRVLASEHLVRGGQRMIESVTAETRYAARRLRGSPGFTGVALTTLTVAIALNVGIFTLLYRAVLSPLPYPAADRLVSIDHAAPGIGLRSIGLSLGLYWEYSRLSSVEAIALYYVGDQTLTGVGTAERLRFLHATPSIGNILGVRPGLGRWFTEADGVTGAAPVVILSHGLWVRRFGAEPSVIGTQIHLDGVAHEVVGVAAPEFEFVDPQIQCIVPLRLDPSIRRVSGFNYEGIARLTPHTSLEEARRQQDRVIAEIPIRFAGDPEISQGLLANGGVQSRMVPLAKRILGDMARLVWALTGATIVMLVVAIANLANLILVRAEARQPELTMRRALGADRRAIAFSTMSEMWLLAAVAGVLGTGVAYACMRLLVERSAIDWPRLHEIRLDGMMLASAALLTIVVALLGALPLLRQVKSGVSADSGSERRSVTANPRALLVRHTLLASQVALAFVLLVTAALLLRGSERLRRADPGFDPAGRLIFEISLPRTVYRTRASAAAFNNRLIEELQQLPGVRSAALTTNLPLEGRGMTNPLEILGFPEYRSVAAAASFRQVSLRYFETLSIPLLRGRVFDEQDVAALANVAVVDEALVQQYFSGADPIGQAIRPAGDGPWLTIVGVVGNTATTSLRETALAAKFYVPGSSTPQGIFIVSSDHDPNQLVPTVRHLVAERDAAVPVARAELLSDIVGRSRQDVTFLSSVFAGTAAVAVALALLGVYGVVAYLVTQRTGEIAIRLALGADPSVVMRLILRQTAAAALLGVTVGIVVTASGGGWLQVWLYDISPTDRLTYTAASAALLLCIGAACWGPARRAARIEPALALRPR